jgi:hypothetical protein
MLSANYSEKDRAAFQELRYTHPNVHIMRFCAKQPQRAPLSQPCHAHGSKVAQTFLSARITNNLFALLADRNACPTLRLHTKFSPSSRWKSCTLPSLCNAPSNCGLAAAQAMWLGVLGTLGVLGNYYLFALFALLCG